MNQTASEVAETPNAEVLHTPSAKSARGQKDNAEPDELDEINRKPNAAKAYLKRQGQQKQD